MNNILHKKLSILTIFFTCIALNAQFNSYYNVRDFGALGDGVTLDTEAVRIAVKECSTEGGTILFPPGKYLIGSIKLESNVDIYIQSGALILGSTDIKDYEEYIPQMKSYNDYFLKHSLFYAEKANNISIRGEGTIDGQGSSFNITTNKKPDRYKNRPFVIRFVQCKNVHIENITLKNSAMWMQQYLACEYLFIKGINVYNHANKNNDMIDIDGCRNVVMSDCIGDTDDDAITLKSTSESITENVTITNCVLSSHCNAIKLGTESTGGFRNIAISNIVIKPSDSPTKIYGHHSGISGITLGMVDGGILDGVAISNIRIDGTQVPIYLRLGNRARKHHDEASQPGVGTFKNVIISDIIATNIKSNIGASISGIPGHSIQNVSLNNIKIKYPGGGNQDDAEKQIPELEDHYPESTKWGILPSYGFFVRHVDDVTFNNVQIGCSLEDSRPAYVLEDVKTAKILNCSAQISENCKSVFEINNSANVSIDNFNISTNVKIKRFLNIKGKESKNIFLTNNISFDAETLYKIENDLSDKIIKIK